MVVVIIVVVVSTVGVIVVVEEEGRERQNRELPVYYNLKLFVYLLNVGFS